MTSPALEQLAGRVRSAARVVARAPSSVRDDALRLAADLLEEEWASLVEANRADLERAEAAGMVEAARDRLRLTEERVRGMAAGLRKVAGLPDPVGEVTEGWVRPNGLRVSRVRVPLGVVGVIYENRPNVTSDAAGLCLKAGNAAFLRGSSSAIDSNRAIVALLRRAAVKAGLPEDAVALVEDTSHETATAFMRLRGFIDCLIPRGGRALIASLIEHATVPYVLDGDGNCHIYIDGAADLAMAHELAVNAKTHRFGVCNAVETILVHSRWRPTSCPGWRPRSPRPASRSGPTSGCGPTSPTPCRPWRATSPPSSWDRWWRSAWSTTWGRRSSTLRGTARATPRRS